MATLKHVKIKSQWKKLEISPALRSNKDFDSLISFEELTDYELVENNYGSKDEKKSEEAGKEEIKGQQKKKRKKKKKRKSSEESGKKAGKNQKQKQGKVLIVNADTVQDINEQTENEEEEKKENAKKEDARKKDLKSAKRKSNSENDNTSQSKKVRMEKDKPVELKDTATVSSDMSGWKNLFVPTPVLKALQHQGFSSPTSIQALALPSAIRDRMDIVGAAETGSGKTLAFGIPILHHILQFKEKQQEKLLSQAMSGEGSGEEDKDSDSAEEDEELDDEEEDLENDNMEDEAGSEDEEESDSANDEGNDEDVDDEDEEDNEEEGGGSDSGVQDDFQQLEDSDDEDEDRDLPPDEEDVTEFEDGGIGCVRVVNNIELDFPDVESVEPQPSQQPHKPLFALILEPTRELAIQVKKHLQAAAKYMDLNIATVVGGMAPQKQQRVLKQCPEIVIATPGRLWELIQQGDPHLAKVKRVHKLVIDEADRMVEKGHFEELTHLLELINENDHQRRKRQTFVFSATLTMLHSGPQRYIKKKKRKKEKLDAKKKLELLMETIGIKERPKIIDLTTKTGTAETLTEARINCSSQEKDLYLFYFLKQYPGRTLVFTNSKDCIRRLVSIFTLLQCNPLPLHADMHQRQRLKNLDKFSGGSDSLLIASDVAARGLDIPDVQHVIHYQVPRTIENYVHRSGRTARAMKEGLSVMLVGPEDVRNYRKIIQNLNNNEDLPLFPVEYNAVSGRRPIINLVRQIDTEDHRFMKKKHKNDWFVKTAEEMDMILDDKALEDPSDREEQQRHKHRQQTLKAELDAMLRQPLKQKTYSGKYPTKMGRLVTPKQADSDSAVQKVKKDRPSQQQMMEYMAAHPRVVKKKKDNRKTRKNEKRKKKKQKMMTG